MHVLEGKRAASQRIGRGLLFWALLVLLAGPGAAGAKINPEEAIPLPAKSRGSLLFYLDMASFPQGPGPARTEIYLRVPGDELVYSDTVKAGSPEGSARLHARLRIRDARGKTVVEEERDVEVPAAERDDKGFSLGHVVVLPAAVPAGWSELKLELQDLRSQKRGLAYIGRVAHRDGKVEGVIHVPAWQGDGNAISEIEAAWSIQRSGGGGDGAFTRGDVVVLPNPTRTYGLFASTLRAYYEMTPATEGAAPLVASARVLDKAGKILLTADPDTVRAGSSWGQVAFDVTTLPAGAYDLEVGLAGASGHVARTLRFNVAWRKDSWEGDVRNLLDEAHLLLDDEEKEDAFTLLTAGEQEAYLESYWAERDPTPSTAANEERDSFYGRIAYANAHFGTTGIEKGMNSDRGRIYIRLGEPDEIRREVMPTNGLQVEDIAKEVAVNEGFDQAVPLKGRGAGSDMRSFEVWSYDRLMHQGSDSGDFLGPKRPMKRVFVFVDEEGYGNYVLRYVNE